MTARTLSHNDVIAQFADAMRSIVPGLSAADIAADGEIHRFTVDGDKPRSGNGWYSLHLDGRPAGAFGSWKSNQQGVWTANGDALSPAERTAFREQAERAQAQRKAQDKARRKQAAQIAADAWAAARGDDVRHAYLSAKGIQACGARIGDFPVIDKETGQVTRTIKDALLLQVRDLDRNIHSVQAIVEQRGEDGARRFQKLFLAGGAKKGHFHAIGQPRRDDAGRRVFLLAEGFATGASIHEATGHSVVCSFDAGNLEPVAKVIRERFPDAAIIVCGDNDVRTDGNPGRAKATAAAAAVGGVAVFPAFSPADVADGATDFNDACQRHGAEAVAAIIDAALRPAHGGEDDLPWDDRELPPVPGSEKPAKRTIQFIAGDLPRVVDEAELSLIEQCTEFYQRAGSIVRPATVRIDVADGRQIEGVRLIAVNRHHMRERLTVAADWQKYDGRAEDFVPINCPMEVADTYLARDGLWKLPNLSGIVNAPTLRHDGSILERPGYDAATGLLFEPGSCTFEPVPEQPTKDDAEAALQRIEALVAGFPFVTPIDRSVALSGILTACVRRSLPTAPMHAFSAPTAGSGKSLLVDIAAIISSGRQAPVLSQGRDEAEAEKRIGGALLSGDQLLSLDNCTQPLDGDLLCQVLTQPVVRLRALGGSTLRDVPTNAAIFATGNGLVVQGDMTRRVLLASLDSGEERPELRKFDFDPRERSLSCRAAYLRDALTVLRAYHIAGRPRQVDELGSFNEWSNWVRSALIWLARADPVATMEQTRSGDPKLEALRVVMHQWNDAIGKGRATTSDVIALAVETTHSVREVGGGYSKPEFIRPELRDALLTVAGQGGAINNRALGRWLMANQNRPVDGMRLQRYGTNRNGVALWVVVHGNDTVMRKVACNVESESELF